MCNIETDFVPGSPGTKECVPEFLRFLSQDITPEKEKFFILGQMATYQIVLEQFWLPEHPVLFETLIWTLQFFNLIEFKEA